ERIAGLIEAAAKTNAAAGSNTRKIADVYHSYMDGVAIEAKGLAPLRPHLDAIAAIHDKHELARALGESLRADVDALNLDNFQTANLSGSESMRDIRAKYQRHVSALLKLAGFTDPDVRAQHIVELEHAIAEKHI